MERKHNVRWMVEKMRFDEEFLIMNSSIIKNHSQMRENITNWIGANLFIMRK